VEEVVLDTSIVVKWFADEEGSDKAFELLDRIAQGTLVLVEPVILPIELANALHFTYKFEASKIRYCLDRLTNMGIFYRQNDFQVMFETSELVANHNLTFYDALFMGVAIVNGCKLITADRKHHKPEFYDKVEYI
jgi:predicted nucleic acid-binding protein